MGGWVQISRIKNELKIFAEKFCVVRFCASMPVCTLFVCTLFSHYDLSVLSMSVMGFQKKLDRGLSALSSYFWNLFTLQTLYDKFVN